LVVNLLCTSRGPIGSYYQLAVVVPLIAIVLLAGGIGAVINGHTATGIVVIVLGLAVAALIIRFLRLPVRDTATDRGQRRTP